MVLEQMKNFMKDLKEQLNTEAAMMQWLVTRFGGVEEAATSLPDGVVLPCTSTNDLHQLEVQIADVNIRMKVVNDLLKTVLCSTKQRESILIQEQQLHQQEKRLLLHLQLKYYTVRIEDVWMVICKLIIGILYIISSMFRQLIANNTCIKIWTICEGVVLVVAAAVLLLYFAFCNKVRTFTKSIYY